MNPLLKTINDIADMAGADAARSFLAKAAEAKYAPSTIIGLAHECGIKTDGLSGEQIMNTTLDHLQGVVDEMQKFFSAADKREVLNAAKMPDSLREQMAEQFCVDMIPDAAPNSELVIPATSSAFSVFVQSVTPTGEHGPFRVVKRLVPYQTAVDTIDKMSMQAARACKRRSYHIVAECARRDVRPAT